MSLQTFDVGAAMFAATACEFYKKAEDAMQVIGKGFGETYHPDREKSRIYARRYNQYLSAGKFIQQSAKLKNI